MDERGLAVEAVMCDGEGCVARLEELSWPEGPVSGVDEALSVSVLYRQRYPATCSSGS